MDLESWGHVIDAWRTVAAIVVLGEIVVLGWFLWRAHRFWQEVGRAD